VGQQHHLCCLCQRLLVSVRNVASLSTWRTYSTENTFYLVCARCLRLAHALRCLRSLERARKREREREPPSLPPCLPASLPPSRPPSLPLPGAHPLHTLEATSATGPSRSHRMCSLTRICSPRGTSFAHARSHKCYRPLTVLTFRANFLAAQRLGLSGIFIFYFILFYFIWWLPCGLG
jgi:hypothetical protein